MSQRNLRSKSSSARPQASSHSEPVPGLISGSHPTVKNYQLTSSEKGVLTIEPYKSQLLPYWRFATPDAARKSAETLWEKFVEYEKADDFIGMDMARKFIQMGMTRAGRYANRKGGRKYVAAKEDAGGKGKKTMLPKVDEADMTPQMQQKRESSDLFKGYWRRCLDYEPYQKKREAFKREQQRLKKSSKQSAE